MTAFTVSLVSLVLFLLLMAPVLAFFVDAMVHAGPDAFDRAVADVERFVELRDRARSARAEHR
jgi:hypothetical protein